MSEKTVVLGEAPIKIGEEDWLGFSQSAKSLAESLMKISENYGVVAGILGDWGSGKTGFMSLVENALKTSENNFITVWFSAWQYQDSVHIGDSLIYRAFEETSKKIPKLKEQLINLEKALGKKKTVVYYLDRILSVAKDLRVALPTIQAGFEAGKALLDEIKPVADIESSIAQLVDVLRTDNKRLIIFRGEGKQRCNQVRFVSRRPESHQRSA